MTIIVIGDELGEPSSNPTGGFDFHFAPVLLQEVEIHLFSFANYKDQIFFRFGSGSSLEEEKL